MAIGESDNYLIDKAQRGDSNAYASLMRRYQRRTETLIAHHISDNGVVCDLRQEVFIKVYKNINQFKQHSSFYTWLYRITRNTVNNYLKHKSYQNRAIEVDITHLEHSWGQNGHYREIANPETLSISDELLGQLSLAYDDLPEDLRVCLSLREFEGLSYDEIAEYLQCPVGTVRSRIHRARLLLKSSLDD